MKQELLERLDDIIDNPSKHNSDEKVNVIIRIVKEIAGQVRGHHTDIDSLREIVRKVQITLESLDNKLFGDRNSEGVIYNLSSEVKNMKNSFENLIRILYGVLGAIIIDIILRFFNVI
jgi:hypothetical protein